MSFKKRVASLALSLAICTGPATAHAADDGVITKPSKYSVKETVTRFETAVKQKEVAGFMVFTEIDHAAARSYLKTDGKWNNQTTKLRIFDAQYVAENVYFGDSIGTDQRRNLCRVMLGRDGGVLAKAYDDADRRSPPRIKKLRMSENSSRRMQTHQIDD
jgi:hypothetical protein